MKYIQLVKEETQRGYQTGEGKSFVSDFETSMANWTAEEVENSNGLLNNNLTWKGINVYPTCGHLQGVKLKI